MKLLSIAKIHPPEPQSQAQSKKKTLPPDRGQSKQILLCLKLLSIAKIHPPEPQSQAQSKKKTFSLSKQAKGIVLNFTMFKKIIIQKRVPPQGFCFHFKVHKQFLKSQAQSKKKPLACVTG